MSDSRVPAVGGQRTIPAPDPIAEAYLLLGLRLDVHDAGVIDAYFGPAALKATVDMEPTRSLARLGEDAHALREEIDREVADPARRRWLAAQIDAIVARIAVLAGDPMPYVEQVERSFDIHPLERPIATLDAAADTLDATLPGEGTVATRLAAFDERVTLRPDAVERVGGRMIEVLRERARPRFGLPDGESLRFGLVRDQTWSAYCWYDGGLHSRIDMNTDLPIRAPQLLDVLGHETYAGHHAESISKDVGLIEGQGDLEHSLLLLIGPQALMSEGLAEVGPAVLLSDEVRLEVLTGALLDGGPTADRAAARDLAELALAIRRPRDRLSDATVGAALHRWADGATTAQTIDYLETVGRMAPDRAAKLTSFIEHPRTQTYVHVYHEGEPLLAAWVEAAPDGDRDARFRRLLREPLTPSAIRADLAV